MSLPQALCASLEAGFNAWLKLDGEIFSSLASLEGRVIAIHITGINETLYLFPGHDGIMILSDFDGEADTTLHGTPVALAKLGLSRDPRDILFSGEVTITGDTRLGQKFRKILSQVDIDWEEILSHYTGDMIAHRLGNRVRELSSWWRRSVSSVQQNSGEYLQEETRVVAANAEVEEFLAQVDKLRDDVARLEARIKRLQEKEH